jgi:hypothetical protein
MPGNHAEDHPGNQGYDQNGCLYFDTILHTFHFPTSASIFYFLGLNRSKLKWPKKGLPPLAGPLKKIV